MVIKYTIPELNAIGEMVLLQECISRMPQYQAEPQYHQVYLPDTTTDTPKPQTRAEPLPNSISADHFLQDYAQFHNHLDQSIQMNRDISWQQQHAYMMQLQQKQDQQLADSVAEFFRKAQQNFRPQGGSSERATRVRRLSEVEAELLGQLKGHLHV